MTIPLPDVPNEGKITDGNERITETRQAVNNLAARVQPVNLGGTGATVKHQARIGLGINSGWLEPSGAADDGDIYFWLQ